LEVTTNSYENNFDISQKKALSSINNRLKSNYANVNKEIIIKIYDSIFYVII